MGDAMLTVLLGNGPGARAAEKVLSELGPTPHIRVLERCDATAMAAQNLLVCAAASQLDDVVDCVSTANKSHRLAALLVHNDVADNWLTYVLYQSGIRALRNMIVHSDPQLPSRVLSAWAIGGQEDFIADAAVISGRLVVRNCAFAEYSLSFEAYPALKQISEANRSNFEIQEDGLLLFWPRDNVHLDLDDIRFANDPKRQQAVRAQRLTDERTMGLAVRRVREDAQLRQADVPGISERQLRRIESGDRISSEALDAIAEAIGISVEDLLERLGGAIAEIEAQPALRELVAPAKPKNAIDADHGPNNRYVPDISIGRRNKVREPLRLAARSVGIPSQKQWTVDVGKEGAIVGHLEYNVTSDTLSFVLDEMKGSMAALPKGRLVAKTAQLSQLLESESFDAAPGARVRIAINQGILASDIVNLEWTLLHEQ